MLKVYLSLGGNVGNRIKYMYEALSLIEERIGKIIKRSSVYESEPWGFKSENMFLNQVLIVETNFHPEELLGVIKNIEKRVGRKDKGNIYSDRIIDIDILFYNGRIINKENLIVPHKLLHKRKFVITPLAEISPDFIHPVIGKSIQTLLDECDDTLNVKLFKGNETGS